MSVHSSYNPPKPQKYTEQVDIGISEGIVNINHNLNTTDFTVYIEEDSTGNQIIIPVDAVDANNASIESTSNTTRTVNVTIIG